MSKKGEEEQTPSSEEDRDSTDGRDMYILSDLETVEDREGPENNNAQTKKRKREGLQGAEQDGESLSKKGEEEQTPSSEEDRDNADEEIYIIQTDSDSVKESREECQETVDQTKQKRKRKGKESKCTKSDQQTGYRRCKAGPKMFRITITRKQWNKLKPKHGQKRLRPPWTDVLYDEFLKENTSCTIAFKYQHVKTSYSRKIKSPFFRASARCTFEGFKAVYSFSKKSSPKSTDKRICFKVLRFGEVRHRNNQRKFRPAKYLRRGKIAKAVSNGVSNYYYSMLKNTPVEEIMAGNFTRSLTKDVLKTISSEVKKSARLHDDVMLELMLTQKVIKESSSHASSKGYLQRLQIDPFAVHLQTDTGINILAQHLKQTPTALYLDATGGVVQKIPDQNKRVLYYALVLPGMGKDKPPLPVTELITNSHSIPSISYWLMEFQRKLSHTTKRRITQVETDYSWALINSVLLSFNKENISMYLIRAFGIVSGQSEQIPKFTVLHLCSAHIMKAVSQAFGRKTGDRGIQEYATFSFAYLLNYTSMQVAHEVFYHMCVLFDAEEYTHLVKQSKT